MFSALNFKSTGSQVTFLNKDSAVCKSIIHNWAGPQQVKAGITLTEVNIIN